MAEFDDNQTAVQYGESLLAGRESQQQKNKKRQKKIQRVNMVLAGVGIADKFMAKNAQKKVNTFTKNLTSEKAQALNDFKMASTFRTNELEKLKQDNPGLDFTNKSSWALKYDEDEPTRVLEAGAIYSALQKEYSQNLRAKYGKGAEGSIASEEKKAYDDEVLESTTRAFNSLVNKYTKYKPSLNTSADLIKSQYEDVIAEGAKQIMSARNTSSIRKLLGKFGIADKLSDDLSNVDLGGVNLNMNKKVWQEQAERKANIADAQAAYDEQVKNVPLKTVRINTALLANALNSQNKNFKTNFSSIEEVGRSYTEQMIKGTDTSPNRPSGIYGPGKNTRAKNIQSILINDQAPLAAIATTDKNVTATLSQLYDSLHAQEGTKGDGMGQIQMRFNYYLNIEAEKELKKLGTSAPDSRELVLTEEIFVTSLSKAITDLVTIGEKKSGGIMSSPLFKVTVKTNSEFVNGTPTKDVKTYKENLLKLQKNKSTLTTFKITKTDTGDFEVLYDPTGAIKPQTTEQFGKTFMNNIINANSNSERVSILNTMKEKVNPDHHPLLLNFYDEALETVNYGDSFDTSKSKYNPTPYLIEDNTIRTGRTENVSKLLNAHITAKKKDGTPRFLITNEEEAIDNLLDKFLRAVIQIESSGDSKAKSSESSASGLLQFLMPSEEYPNGSAIPALNRVEKYLGKREWGEELRKHGDASLLTAEQQVELFIGNILEKTVVVRDLDADGNIQYNKKGKILTKEMPGLGDELMQKVFDGDMEGMLEAYYMIHHTNPDKATREVAEREFKKYF
jgi:hypothetical protein